MTEQTKATNGYGPAIPAKSGAGGCCAAVLTQAPLEMLLPEPLLAFDASRAPRPTVVFRSEHAGAGDPELGSQLMAEFIQALLDHPEPPLALLFYHSAVKLTLDDSPVIEPLRLLAKRGSEALVCAASLQSLTPPAQPAVGRAAPLAELVDRMRQAQLLLWP